MHKGRVLFCVFLIAVAAYAVWAAVGWTFKAKLFPLTVSIPLMVLAAIQLVAEIFGKADTGDRQAMDFEFASDVAPELARRRAIGAFLWVGGFILLVYLLGFPWAVPVFVFSYLHLGQAMDIEFASDVAPKLARRRAIGAFLWVGGFILLVYLLGFPWAVPVFVFSNLHLQSRIGLPVSAALTAATWLFFYGLFQRLLHLPFEDGLIQTLLGM